MKAAYLLAPGAVLVAVTNATTTESRKCVSAPSKVSDMTKVYGKSRLLTAPDSQCNCLAEQPSLEGKVYFPNSTAYGGRMDTYWSLSAALEPWCMVLPESPEEVSVMINAIVDNECSFGIRGGGHGTHALSNTLEQGVTVDMGKISSARGHLPIQSANNI